MLRNPLYRGERVWNRSEWIKDHETGRRQRFERPETEWVRQYDEAWRIVSDELWPAAQEARGRRNERYVRDEAGTKLDGRTYRAPVTPVEAVRIVCAELGLKSDEAAHAWLVDARDAVRQARADGLLLPSYDSGAGPPWDPPDDFEIPGPAKLSTP